jgi:hypothetical protein
MYVFPKKKTPSREFILVNARLGNLFAYSNQQTDARMESM